MAIRFVALETSIVRNLQAGGADANGHPPERHISTGGAPCRHCLTKVPEGESYLIVSHRPFPVPQPYAEQGPVFLHAGPCERHIDNGEIPQMLTSAQYLMRGYNGLNRIVYGSGLIVAPADIRSRAAAMFDDPQIAYIHVRSASYNCYQCRIERASEFGAV
ncbi:MAG TPA: DUF1203 domain-containing protein [Hyphomicrobiales bacterium]|nr:DUF1203 domain-containing protein [Hyphomicrobiales bacterium]